MILDDDRVFLLLPLVWAFYVRLCLLYPILLVSMGVLKALYGRLQKVQKLWLWAYKNGSHEGKNERHKFGNVLNVISQQTGLQQKNRSQSDH